MPRLSPSRPENWSLRVRILVITGVVAAVVGSIVLAGYVLALNRILDDTATTSARDQARQIAALVLEQEQRASRTIEEIPSQGALLQLLSEDGQVVAYSDRAAAASALSQLRPRPGQTLSEQVVAVPSDPDDPYAVAVTGLDRATPDGATMVVVAVPLQTETTVVKGATALLGGVGVMLLVALLWLINRVVTSALSRVERIRSAVASIRAGDRSSRVLVPRGQDEINRLAATMNSMLDRLERADQAQRHFVSNASHELRSPLTTIRTITETSPAGVDPAATEVIASQARRMHRLVEDLLTLAKADDDGLSLRSVDVDIDDLVIAQVRRLRASTALTVQTQIDPVRVSGDPMRLDQVLNNLVDNAVRHARTSVALACFSTASHAVVQVDNDGEAVPLEQRQVIFERFSRLQESRDRDTGGSGLGLAIVQAIVTAHSGSVTTGESETGWCRFTVRLPLPFSGPAMDSDEEQVGPPGS